MTYAELVAAAVLMAELPAMSINSCGGAGTCSEQTAGSLGKAGGVLHTALSVCPPDDCRQTLADVLSTTLFTQMICKTQLRRMHSTCIHGQLTKLQYTMLAPTSLDVYAGKLTVR